MLAQADAAEIKLLASNALRSALQEIAPQFETTRGHKILITFGSTGNLTASIDKGTPFDLAVVGADAVDNLIGRGLVVGPRRDFARSGIGVSYREGASKPDVSTSVALKATLLAAKSISFNSQGLSGSHMVSVIDRMGIAAQVMPKVIVPAVSASEDVAKGVAELGITQVGEIVSHTGNGAELAGPLPPDVQLDTVFAVAIGAKAREPGAATALIEFLRAPAVVRVLKAKGLEPG
jgi:molybdate transport system substrate-binding protein